MALAELTVEGLFGRFFRPLYPDPLRPRALDQGPASTGRIDEIAETFAHLAPEVFGAPDLPLDYTDASVHRLSALLTRERRDAWLAPRGGGEPPMLVTIVTHGALYVGACVVRGHGGAWLVRQPLWESQVRLVSPAGTADLAVFHWWLKALSDDEIDRGRLVDRYRTHVEEPTFDVAQLAPIAPAARRLPRLTRVRYGGFHEHLRAHLPELRSVGEDFPDPERFDELGFTRLDFALLGGGRMLLVYGPGRGGLHLLWLTSSGFFKAAYFPADASPAPVVELDGDKLRITLAAQGRRQVHEMLWWGA